MVECKELCVMMLKVLDIPTVYISIAVSLNTVALYLSEKRNATDTGNFYP